MRPEIPAWENEEASVNHGETVYRYEERRGGIIFPPGTEVFRRLVGLNRDEDAAVQIVKDTIRKDIRRIVIVGCAGDGKTTILNQLFSTLEANQSRPVMAHFYDDFLTGDPNYDDTLSFNKDMFSMVRQEEELNPNSIGLVELVAVGKSDERDRGVSALGMFANDSSLKGHDTFFVVLTGNSAVELRAGFIRGIVRELVRRPEEIIPQLRAHNIVPVGFGEGIEGGKDIGRYVSAMGKAEHIKAIRAEEEELIDLWKRGNPDEFEQTLRRVRDVKYKEVKEVKKVYKEFGINFRTDREAQGFASFKVAGSATRERAAFAVWRLGQLGVPDQNVFVVHNRPKTGPIEMVNPKARKTA